MMFSLKDTRKYIAYNFLSMHFRMQYTTLPTVVHANVQFCVCYNVEYCKPLHMYGSNTSIGPTRLDMWQSWVEI